MSAEEFARRMKEIAESGNGSYINHRDADELMCEALYEFGYDEGVDIYRNIDKLF